MKNILYVAVVLGAMFVSSCEPNADIYDKLDANKNPYNKKITYTLTAADYGKTVTGNATVDKYKAFMDSLPAANFVPKVLAKNFPALNTNSEVVVTYNYLVPNVYSDNALFGYELTDADYGTLGNATVATNKSFDGTNKSTALLPAFLLTKYPTAVANDTQNVVIKYNYALNLERYAFDGAAWSRATTNGVYSNFAQIGYTLLTADYIGMGGDVARFKNFSTTVLSENYLPVFLKSKYPYAIEGAIKVLKFKYFSGSASDKTEMYKLTSGVWVKMAAYNLVAKIGQYIYGPEGWVFDPTVRLTMVPADYQIIATNDPIPDPVFTDFGLYYGASGKYGNFDNRLSKRKASNPEMTDKTDSECITIMMNRLPAAIKVMLENKYKTAVPIVGGLEVHYIIIYKVYNNDLSYTTYSIDYKCTAAGNPATFELISGPTEVK
ncbi:hypothetical protein [Williamwhitmania taraxaci]|uniref:DUF4270 domain-containing protein n=1 Tax=Williamwhitmania taraxaci TaxID=1640674 RepID=A0A1G6QXS8_9BACT|nr:hypothetical protein [Williamwhitmania taraxaci]SDC97138.1 hypothetical protein SAMN05216323_10676 [Williamwhitmania taraxaci]